MRIQSYRASKEMDKWWSSHGLTEAVRAASLLWSQVIQQPCRPTEVLLFYSIFYSQRSVDNIHTNSLADVCTPKGHFHQNGNFFFFLPPSGELRLESGCLRSWFDCSLVLRDVYGSIFKLLATNFTYLIWKWTFDYYVSWYNVLARSNQISGSTISPCWGLHSHTSKIGVLPLCLINIKSENLIWSSMI